MVFGLAGNAISGNVYSNPVYVTSSSTLDLASSPSTQVGTLGISSGVLAIIGSGSLTTGVVNISASGAEINQDRNGGPLLVAGLNGAAGSQITLGGGVLTVNGTAGSNFAGTISGTGSLVQAGTDTLTLGGSNTYTGNTPVNSGVLQAGAANVLPCGPGTGNLNLATAQPSTLTASPRRLNGLNGAGTVNNRAASTSAVLTVGNNDASSTFTGAL